MMSLQIIKHCVVLGPVVTVAACVAAVVIRVKLADYYHARGYAARKQGNFAGAVEEYSRALSLTPNHFKALFNRGFSYDKVSRSS